MHPTIDKEAVGMMMHKNLLNSHKNIDKQDAGLLNSFTKKESNPEVFYDFKEYYGKFNEEFDQMNTK
jgi:hypothetical protein